MASLSVQHSQLHESFSLPEGKALSSPEADTADDLGSAVTSRHKHGPNTEIW